MTIKINWLDRPLLFSPYIVLCLSQKEMEAAQRRLKVPANRRYDFPDSGATTQVYEKEGSNNACIVCLSKEVQKSAHEAQCSIVHEAVHVYQKAMEYMGETNPGEEIQAYCIERIFETLATEYRRRKVNS